jgi:hypothetical protein
MCVQRLDDSRSAFRITYRISLRSSSSQEPRYPLLKVVALVSRTGASIAARDGRLSEDRLFKRLVSFAWQRGLLECLSSGDARSPPTTGAGHRQLFDGCTVR